MLLENLPKCYDSWASLVIHLSLQQAVRMLQVHATTCHLYAVLVPAWRSSSCVLQFGTLGLLSHMPARKLPQVKKVAKKVWALLPSLEGSSTTNLAHLFSSFKLLKIALYKKKILRHIKLAVYAWSTKYRRNQKLIAQFTLTLRDESFKPN